MIRSHKIRLDPTVKQKIYFSKACGIARFTWNWALARYQEKYANGEKTNALELKKEFNSMKKDHFPWIYEVTKYASQQPFIFLRSAFSAFFSKTAKYPKFKKKGVHDSFYIGGDQIKVQGKRIKIPNLGWVRMREELRFSGKIQYEMTQFIEWFNESCTQESCLARAAVAHVYFESIHPFEDGNGRIGRALVEKALSQNLGHPTLIAFSKVITNRKKDYYSALGDCNKTLHIQKWVDFFAEVIVQSQEESLSLIHFLMAKSKLMTDLKGKINHRQEMVLLRMFQEGLKGFAGSLSAENYISITKTSRATATRDLADLVKKGALFKTGELRHTRYWLNIP